MNIPVAAETSPLHGLTAEESRRRLQEYGENEVSTVQGRSVFRIIRETLREPMFLLLIGAAA
ncbi:MAG: cation-transporting P-type ATPase, partial [Hyphomonas sp.]|nr:cation-transporting P-type ATPase [Hyphomonas sp.]